MNYGILNKGSKTTYDLNDQTNGTFIKVIKGEIEVCGIHLREKDEIGIEEMEKITINSLQESEIMVFELPIN